MRRIAGLLAASALATLATFAVSPGTAFAAAPKPVCDSGLQHFLCDGMSTGTTVWTITYYQNGVEYTHNITTSGPSIYGGCPTATSASVYYTGVYQGVTQTSAIGHYTCRSGPWR